MPVAFNLPENSQYFARMYFEEGLDFAAIFLKILDGE
jgi:hypothetical protein